MSSKYHSLGVDLNCDLGEGMDNEKDIMPYITSCSIACGGHAGNEKSMQDAVALAMLHNVDIGAHPSYPDKKNFGRKVQDISYEDLLASLVLQIQNLKNIIQSSGGKLHHVKAHGALYNEACSNEFAARVALDAIKKIDSDILLYAPFESVIARLAPEYQVQVMYEAFADRNYNDDLTLVSRDSDAALITDPEKMLQHVLPMLSQGEVVSLGGKRMPIKVDTLCIHSDTENAAALIKSFRQLCLLSGISIQYHA